MPENLHVRVPFRQLTAELPFLMAEGLNPEIALQGSDLDETTEDLFAEFGAQLRATGLSVTVHAPFHDLNPGALEQRVREVTFERCRQALLAAARLGARLIVFHPGFDHWKYGSQDHLWLQASRGFWPPLLALAEEIDCQVVLENIFERHPHLLAALISELGSSRLGHCFDVGHWHLFAHLSLPEWFEAIGPHIRHLHLHDNHGHQDDHLPIGAGCIDFPLLFRLVTALPRPPSMTLELTNREALLRALAGLAPFLGR